jgi:endonuclease YncB( thermonuclease family)
MKNKIILGIFILVVSIILGTSTDIILQIKDKAFDVVPVLRVIDGDTIFVRLDEEDRYVRLLGVDSPESVKSGTPVEEGALEASDFTKQLKGKWVILTYDTKKEDFFGRLLAYVWVLSDNGQLICWNIELIKNDHSELYTKYKFNGIEWFKEYLSE